MGLKETTNNVFTTGQLVKKDFEYKKVDVKDENGNVIRKDDAISGALVIRTADGSENEFKYYSRKTKNDGTPNGIYSGLETIKNEYKALEQFPNEADIISIGAGQFSINDYKNKDGEVKSYTEIKANFANRLTPTEIQATPMESKFEIEGVIEKIAPEEYKNELTGNARVTVNVLGYKGTIIPVIVTVPKEMAEPFMAAGFYEGGYAKFTGKLINTKEQVEVVEKMSFGADNVKVVTTTLTRKEVTGGNPMGNPIEHDINDDEYLQAKAKRKLKLDEIKNKQSDKPTTSPVTNPFAVNSTPPTQNAFNPFAKK